MWLIIWIKFENQTVKYKAVLFSDLSISHKLFYVVVHVLFLFPSYHVLDKYYTKCENAWLRSDWPELHQCEASQSWGLCFKNAAFNT